METLIRNLSESGQSKHKVYINSSLVVDEVGYLSVTPQEANLFFQFISHIDIWIGGTLLLFQNWYSFTFQLIALDDVSSALHLLN